jgi:formate C-acetyltransferase
MQSKEISLGNREGEIKYTLEDFPNLKDIREYVFHGPIEFCIERGSLLTAFLKEKGGLDYTDPFTRQVDITCHILKNKKPNIFPNDLLAGSSTSKRKGVLFFPEFLGTAIWPELLTMSNRVDMVSYKISIDDVLKVDQEILPYWMDKNVMELVRKKIGDNRLRLWDNIVLYMVSKFNCISHTIPDLKSVLENGLEGMINDTKDKLASLNESDNEKIRFYKGIIKVMEAIIEFSNRLSKEALRQRDESNDKLRKEQLLKISHMCKKVPAKSATSFREAVQSIWLCLCVLFQEQNDVGFSIGRIDQLLNPFYEEDLKQGFITRKDAVELLSHFWLKCQDHSPMVPEAGDLLAGGSASNQAITIGGCDKTGKNTVNKTTFIVLDVTELMHLRDPNVNARIRADDPEEYTQRVAEVIINTGSTPSLINDKVVIPAIQNTGVSLEDARDYAQVGCLEPTSTGRTFGHTGAILLNLMAALELVFNNGNTERSENLGVQTGELSSLESFSLFMDATKKQLRKIVEKATSLNNVAGEIHRYIHPQPILSALFEGPYDSGKCLLDGGAKYNSSGIAFIGMSDLIDSLYAIKKLVYNEKKVSFNELVEILNSDFRKRPDLYRYVRNKLDHFGNDIKEIDDIGAELVDFLYGVCRSIKNYRNGYYNPGYWSMTIHSSFGRVTRANPHGRIYEESLTSGLTPVSFGQKNGPTAVFNSLAHLDGTKMPNGMALNMKFSKTLFKQPGKLEIFKSLFKSYFEKGGMQVQYIIHDAKTLKDARDHPENYSDLMVRISGYTAYFNDLNEFMKEEIIERAEMNL